MGVRGMKVKGFEDGTEVNPSFSNIYGDGTINMNMGGSSSEPLLGKYFSPNLLNLHEGSAESTGVVPGVDSDAISKQLFNAGPTASLDSLVVLVGKGYVESQKWLEIRKVVTPCMDQFDLVLKGLGPNDRRA